MPTLISRPPNRLAEKLEAARERHLASDLVRRAEDAVAQAVRGMNLGADVDARVDALVRLDPSDATGAPAEEARRLSLQIAELAGYAERPAIGVIARGLYELLDPDTADTPLRREARRLHAAAMAAARAESHRAEASATLARLLADLAALRTKLGLEDEADLGEGPRPQAVGAARL